MIEKTYNHHPSVEEDPAAYKRGLGWKSSQELEVEIQAHPNKAGVSRLFACAFYFRNALYPADYNVSADWENLIDLSKEGEKILNFAKEKFPDLSRSELLFLVFLVFAHHSILVDDATVQIEKIEELLSDEISNSRILLPSRFGRMLYDRFGRMDTQGRLDHLPTEQVQKLVTGTPQGVYQIGSLVSGPYGLVLSQEKRLIPPSRNLPLWHCSDTGCGALHSVECIPFDGSPTRWLSSIEDSIDGEMERFVWLVSCP